MLTTVPAQLTDTLQDAVIDPLLTSLSPVLDGVLSQIVGLTINDQPSPGQLGPDSFTVRAVSVSLLPAGPAAEVNLAASTVRISDAPPDDPRADEVRVVQGQEITFNVLANDGPAAEGATFTRARAAENPKLIGEATGPTPASTAHGSVTCIDSGPDRGQCTYRSLDSYTGTDGFDYALRQSYQTWNVHVTITVVPTNHTPTARETRAVATAGGDPITIRPLANDTDPDDDTLSIAEATVPAGTAGEFSCTDTACTYTPEQDWTGVIEIPYTLTDRSTTTPGPATATSTIRIYVDPPPLDARGFHDRASTEAPAAAGNWQETTTITSATPMCTAGRPATRITWQNQDQATGWVLERRLAPTGGADPAWQRVASLGAGTTEGTDASMDDTRSGLSAGWPGGMLLRPLPAEAGRR